MLATLGRYRVSLVTIAYDSPLSLTAAVAKWDANGLLELVRGACEMILVGCFHVLLGALRRVVADTRTPLRLVSDGRQGHVAECAPPVRNRPWCQTRLQGALASSAPWREKGNSRRGPVTPLFILSSLLRSSHRTRM